MVLEGLHVSVHSMERNRPDRVSGGQGLSSTAARPIAEEVGWCSASTWAQLWPMPALWNRCQLLGGV